MNQSKSTVKRSPKRAQYETEAIHNILDQNFLGHVGFVHQNYPVVIPTMYGRDGDHLYIHGASVSRLIKDLEKGIALSMSVANVSGLVLARSAFHHSLNYESVVIFGKGQLVEGEEKLHALKVISDHLIKDRWEEVRAPNPTEMKATKVIKITMEEASAKQRTGAPIDDKADYELDIWAGVVPIQSNYGKPIPDAKLSDAIALPESVRNL
jgi:nitroimidazol reductase NimA-like FMN-containing flavoprotein (pyridoxamine 5'-phosphate oxidase superfamily)